jgi:VWFA-related protein
MKSKLNNFLTAMVLQTCFVFFWTNISVSGQSADNLPNETKVFGYSLKISEKKKKDKGKEKKEKQPPLNPIEKSSPIDDEIIRVETTLVLNEVLVLDKYGNSVKGLTKEDFIVTEDNQLQEISTFLSGDSETIPRSIVLIIDHSFSQLPYIETSIEAAKVLVDKLNPNDRMAIVTDNVELLQNFTNDKNLLKDNLESLKISALSGNVGPSKQYSALMATLNEMLVDETLRPIIIFQTDGDEFFNLKGEVANSILAKEDAINFSYRDILTATEKTQTIIYTIIPGLCFNSDISKKRKLEKVNTYLEESEKISAQLQNITLKPNRPKRTVKSLEAHLGTYQKYQSAIAEIAKLTGGSTSYLEQPEQAEKIYTEILREMNERYVIGYYPQNQERDGKTRNLTTEVRGHPEYKIIGRKTYILR